MTLGSFIVGFLYYGAAFLCLVAFAGKKRSAGGIGSALSSFARALRHRLLDMPELARAAAPWLMLSLFLFAFGFCRQLNLQVAVTDRFQSIAIIEGWYEERSARQLAAAAAVAASGLVSLLLLGVLLRRRLRDVGLAVLGTVSIVTLISVRTISHHGLDVALGVGWHGIPLAHVLELAGLGTIGAAAALSARRSRSTRPR